LDQSIVFSVFLIFTGAAVLATLALYARQSMLVAYIILGMAIGPSSLGLVKDVQLLQELSRVGIVFLLFLLGLNLHPQNLWHLFRKASLVTLVSSALFAGLGVAVATLFGYDTVESVIIGAAMMFSSTIIGLKLLPSTVLRHRHPDGPARCDERSIRLVGRHVAGADIALFHAVCIRLFALRPDPPPGPL
jgi:Kef-type K+ transport system membrane component KefB